MRVLISALLLMVLAGPASALTAAHANADGGVTIRSNVSNGAVVDPGDAVSFQYQTTRDGAVVVFDIDTQGYVSLLTDEPVDVRAHETGQLPDEGSQLSAEGEPGVEFVFAVSVADRAAIDSDALSSLRNETRRINGDPFVAANMITAELVRDISQQKVFMGYTYFYVSDRVDYPCYLCGTCDGSARQSGCEGYHIAQNFDRSVAMAYPLARGYDMVEVGSNDGAADSSSNTVAMPENQDEVNFYPYGSEVHYADPVALNLWYTWGWYDPTFWYYPYSYPYCYSPWSFSVGFGWGWGWGGYYCSGWYNPWCGGGYYPGYYPSYPASYPGSVVKFKSQYKSGSAAPTLAANWKYAARHDGDLQVASKGVRTSTTPISYRSKTMAFGTSPNGTRHVKTSITGSRSVVQGAWADGRNRPAYSGRMYRNHDNAGRTVMDRGGYRSRAGYTTPSTGGTTRMKSGSAGQPYRSRTSWMPATRSTPQSGGHNSAPVMRNPGGSSHSAPGYRGSWGGGGWGGAGGGSHGGGAFKGGGGGGGHGRGR